MTKIIAISDTHTLHHKVDLPDGDILIHAGDFTSFGRRQEVHDFFEWLTNNVHKYTYGIAFIAGNHDRSFDSQYMRHYEYWDLFKEHEELSKPSWVQQHIKELPSNIHYLENESVNLGGLNIWGSPYSPWFYGDTWAFNKHRGKDISKVWKTIPNNTDIIVTHSPVAHILDQTFYTEEFVGCADLRTIVKQIQPKLHVSGHIHESYGIHVEDGTTYLNASICNLDYKPVNKPLEINLH